MSHEVEAVMIYLEEFFDHVEDVTLDPNEPTKRNPRDVARRSMSFRVKYPNGEAVLVVSDIFLDDWSPHEIRQKLELADTAEMLRNASGRELMMQGNGQLASL